MSTMTAPIPSVSKRDLLPPLDVLLDAARQKWTLWKPARNIGKSVAFDVVLGNSRTELVTFAHEGSFDLLVIGAHGEWDAKMGVGSTAAACVQRAAPRVLVVREGQTDAFRSVVACVDFSETSRFGLEQAVCIAAQDGAKLQVLHVYEDPWRAVPPSPQKKAVAPQFSEVYQQALKARLLSFCEPLIHEIAALKATLHVQLFHGHGQGILDFVHVNGCDLVVLGRRAKWNVRDFVWGSTAERVVREAPCSVLAVKSLGVDQR